MSFLQDLLKGGKDAAESIGSGFSQGAQRLISAFDKQKPIRKKDRKFLDNLDRRVIRSLSKEDEDVDEAETPEQARLNQRIGLRDDITNAFKLRDPDAREAELSRIRETGIDPDGDFGIDESAMDREILEERRNFVGSRIEKMQANRDAKKAKQKADYDDFFARANSPNRTLGGGGRLGETRNLYSRNGKLRIADRLRKKGYGRAAEAIALDYGRSAEASAPAIMTPALRAKMDRDAATAAEIRSMNDGYTQRLIRLSDEELRGGGGGRNRNRRNRNGRNRNGRNRDVVQQFRGGALASDTRLGFGSNNNRRNRRR